MLERRRVTRGAGDADVGDIPNPVRLWQEAVHIPGTYDLEVDTSILTPEACAEAIRDRLENVTLPMLSPTILFAAVTAVISGLQIFDEPFVMVRGGPGDASRTAVMLIYESAFKNIELGYAAAIAAILFLVILLVTAIQFRISKALVFYQ